MELSKILNDEFTVLKSEIAANLRRAGHSDKSVEKIEMKTGETDAEIIIPDEIKYAETGRGPAKGGNSNGIFLQNLKDWIKAKGLNVKDDAEAERLAAFLKWRINKFGTKQWQQGRRYDIYTSAVRNFEQRVADRLAQESLQQLINEIWK